MRLLIQPWMTGKQQELEDQESIGKSSLTYDEFLLTFKKGKRGKRGGIDGLSQWLIKNSIEEIKEIVWKVVEEVWQTEKFEMTDIEGLLVLLPKAGRDKTTWKGLETNNHE